MRSARGWRSCSGEPPSNAVSTSDVPARLIRVFLSELDERLNTFDADLVALERPGADAERAETVTRLFRDAHSLKGAAASIGATGIELVCQQLEDLLAKVRDGALTLDGARFEALFAASDELRAAGRRLAGDAPTPTPAAAGRVQPLDTTLRVPADTVDALLEQSGELLVAHHRSAYLQREIAGVSETIGQLREVPALKELHRSLERIASAMQSERVALQRASAALDEGIRSIRLLPFAIACEGLERVVRDAAKATGKRVRLEIDGAEVGIDRVVIERLRDPLVALVRNAVDHGIEPPAERARRGKPPEGTVRLSVRPNSLNVEIAVSDDGRGLDLDALRRRVNERGLDFDERDLARAVFLPGISTAASVTTLSGRGVGLDVVRTEVEALSGTAEVRSSPATGTSFHLNVPLTVATLRAILVSAARQTFGLNLTAVERVVRIDPASLASIEGRTVLLLGEGAVPLVPLRAALGIAPLAGSEPEQIALLVRRGADAVALAVDALLDERDVHLRSLGPRLRKLPFFSGAAVAADGSLALILRTTPLIDGARAAARTQRSAPAPAPAAAAKRVLLVDDSITTRTLERSILEAAGFEVLTAADGHAAWEVLGTQSVDLVVSDVDMPRMDGFALVEAIRASASHRELPVILVTARENETDRRRGLEIGADAYIVKSSFRQEELLDAIGALT